MEAYRVMPLGRGQWGVRRTRDDRSAALLPVSYGEASEAAYAVLEITLADLRRETAVAQDKAALLLELIAARDVTQRYLARMPAGSAKDELKSVVSALQAAIVELEAPDT